MAAASKMFVELSPTDRRLLGDLKAKVDYTAIARELQRLYPQPTSDMTPNDFSSASAIQALGYALDELGARQ